MKITQGVTRAELCFKRAGAGGEFQVGFSTLSFHLCKEQLKTTPGKPGEELNFYLVLKI